MATAAKKPKLDDSCNISLPACPYGIKCYRKNPEHLKEYSHTKDYVKDSCSTKLENSKLPPCKYGSNCYRTNLLHFAEFSHPFGSTPIKSGSDTEEYDSDEDDEESSSGSDLKLAKSYSMMTDAERKKVIEDALAEKERLQKELEKSRNIIEEKKKAMEKLQEEVNKGVLFVEGERETLAGNETKYFPLYAERSYREGSADQLHFRLAESQFYRLLVGTGYRVVKVEYVVNPKLVSRFREAQKEISKERGEKFSYPILAFHGTDQKNIIPICENGFKVPGEKGFKHKTDTGYFGAGVYFSEYPSYSMGYISGATKLLLSQVIQGRIFECKNLIQGAPCKDSYDSHTSPDKKEIVIFHSDRILPQYIVHYTNQTGEFRYIKPQEKRKKFPGGKKLKDLYDEATKKPKSSLFQNIAFTISGRLVASQENMEKLIQKHGGTTPKSGFTKYHISTVDKAKNLKAKPTALPPIGIAGVSGTILIREDFVYDSIIAEDMKDAEDYSLED